MQINTAVLLALVEGSPELAELHRASMGPKAALKSCFLSIKLLNTRQKGHMPPLNAPDWPAQVGQDCWLWLTGPMLSPGIWVTHRPPLIRTSPIFRLGLTPAKPRSQQILYLMISSATAAFTNHCALSLLRLHALGDCFGKRHPMVQA